MNSVNSSSPWQRFAWAPVPLLLAAIVALRMADLRTAYESRHAMLHHAIEFLREDAAAGLKQ